MEMKQISETTLKITISMEDLADRGMELKDFLLPQEMLLKNLDKKKMLLLVMKKSL